MYQTFLILIILLNFLSINAQEDYRIFFRARDEKYTLLEGEKVLIPYQKGPMFFLRGQGQEVLVLNSLDKYYPYTNSNPDYNDKVVVYGENGLAAIYYLWGQPFSDYYCYSFDDDCRLGYICPTTIDKINKQMNKYGFTLVSYYGSAIVTPPKGKPYKVNCKASRGIISYKGELLFQPVYDHIYFSFEEYEKAGPDQFLIWFKREGIIGIRDIWGEELLTFPDINSIEDIYTGERFPKLNNKNEFILLTRRTIKNKTKFGLLKLNLNDLTIKFLLKNDYDRIENLAGRSGGILLCAKMDDSMVLINHKFETINDIRFNKIENLDFNVFKNNYYLINVNNKYGIINYNGKLC